jgi:hypothetical protein
MPIVATDSDSTAIKKTAARLVRCFWRSFWLASADTQMELFISFGVNLSHYFFEKTS